MKILAIIVTYNRCKLLERCLSNVRAQSRVLDKILVINNSSTDDTEVMLQQLAIEYITQPNLGAAAGWSRGISYALANDYDAVWMMDDDGYPDVDALAKLEKALKPPRVCVSSVVLQENNPENFVFPFPVLNHQKLPLIFGAPRKIKQLKTLQSLNSQLLSKPSADTYPFAHLFNGALISIAAIKIIGNVNQDFYIYGEEVDYFFRLRKLGEVVSHLQAFHYHPDVTDRNLSDAKLYYYLKNTLILNKRYFDKVWLRQLMAIFATLVRSCQRNGPGYLFKAIFKAKIYLALIRGLQGKIANDFN